MSETGETGEPRSFFDKVKSVFNRSHVQEKAALAEKKNIEDIAKTQYLDKEVAEFRYDRTDNKNKLFSKLADLSNTA